MVGYAGSRTYTAYVDITLTRSKVKVTGLLNFRQLAKPCMLAAMTAAPLRGFLVFRQIIIQRPQFEQFVLAACLTVLVNSVEKMQDSLILVSLHDFFQKLEVVQWVF